MRVFTVATDSTLSCSRPEELETNIWNATVRSVPAGLLGLVLVEGLDPGLARPSLEIVKPDGRICTVEVSSPLNVMLIAVESIGA